MIPTVGRIVHYTLSAQDAERVKFARGVVSAQQVGNDPEVGQVYPMLIVRCWGTTAESSVNGQVFLDGNDTLWVTSVGQGDGPRQWHEPQRTLADL